MRKLVCFLSRKNGSDVRNSLAFHSARWHVVDQGAEQDIHNSHWHGMTLLSKGHYMDQFSLFAGQTFTGDMVLDNPGTWWFHCHVSYFPKS
jgi:hypothetical protein